MKKNTLLYILLIFLVVANGYFLYNQFNGKGKRDHKGPPKGPVEFIVKKLNFSDAQIAQLEDINTKHREKIRSIFKDTRVLKDKLFNSVSEEGINRVKIDSIINSIGLKEKEKEVEVFFHLRAIRNLCNDAQKQKFERIIKDAMHQRGRQGGEGPRH